VISPSSAISTAIAARPWRCACRAGLQHPQLAALDGELEVLHVAVVRSSRAEIATNSAKASGIAFSSDGLSEPAGDARRLGDVLRRADAGHHVLALRVDQELAVERLLAGRGIAGEGNAGGRRLAHVAEHHRLHVDGRAPAFGNLVQAPVGDGARFIQLEKTAPTAPHSCSCGSCGNGSPSSSSTFAL
jgi:hypothetical protein